ncbi:Borealin-lik [Purpureocillium lavendulum]|uniref:Borealin-lik n=1 Tax=Purpureocillium lavendulum TaxID=1247861 RepID=A0AB34G2Z5_9HYPO|nr:Borealin-lik [Purpureocillium lavendulum]
MAPVRQKKRGSDQSTASTRRQGATEGSKVPLRSSPSTPHNRSPIRKQRKGLSLHQKQALIDNLQLEITERARRLRAQYNIQAQGLRSRVEIRINRIPMSLRKIKMGDLLLKYAEQEKQRIAAAARPPPVPAKDTPRASPQKPTHGITRPQVAGRAYNARSNELAGDKENERENMDQKRRARPAQGPDPGHVRPTQVLSPTSSNSRLNRDRPASPTKSQIARPGSPLKSTGTSRSAAMTSVLSNMVERAKATRHHNSRDKGSQSRAHDGPQGCAAVKAGNPRWSQS